MSTRIPTFRPTQFLAACIFLLAMSAVAAPADSPAKTAPATTKKPTPAPNYAALFKQHWVDRVKLFRDENRKFLKEREILMPNVVLLGDSITEGFDVKKYFPDRRVLNRGIGADIIGNALPDSDKRGILRRMDESVFDCNPSDVFILIGINDLGSGHKPATIESGYREILHQIKKKAPKVRVHIQSVLPCRGNYAKHNANVNDVNARLQKLAKEFGYDYVDLHSKMIDDKGELKQEFTPEGLHLKPAAYKVWKAEIEHTLNW